jgi:hypothetical protein
LFSHQGKGEKEKNESGDSSENGICSCGFPACCCQPAVAGSIIYADLWGELSTHLAPKALFAQSSPVQEPLLQAVPFPSTLGKMTLQLRCQACVFIYSSCGRWVFPPLLCSSPPTATFTSFPAPGYWVVLLLLPATMFVYSSREKWVFPPLLWSFPPSATLTSFPAPGCWARAPAPARGSPACVACLFAVYLQSWEGFPSPNLRCSGCPTLFSTCLYCSYCLLLSFSFFPGWRTVWPGGYAALAQACLWEYHSTMKLTWSASFQAVWARATGGLGALLVSPFNMKWRFSEPAGGVEGSKLCLFSVIMPTKCVSSVSPRFHSRRLAFCFLPLATILESPCVS